jgi:hypothetical protein
VKRDDSRFHPQVMWYRVADVALSARMTVSPETAGSRAEAVWMNELRRARVEPLNSKSARPVPRGHPRRDSSK